MICKFDQFCKIVEFYDNVFIELDAQNHNADCQLIDWDSHINLKSDRLYQLISHAIPESHLIHGNENLIQYLVNFIIKEDDTGGFTDNILMHEVDNLYALLSDLLHDTEIWEVELAALENLNH